MGEIAGHYPNGQIAFSLSTRCDWDPPISKFMLSKKKALR
jgi:hypothetical protein